MTTAWVTYWDELPEGRLLFRPESEEYVRNLLTVFPIDERTRILDFGCGYGAIAEALAEQASVVCLWDAAESMRRTAVERLADRPNVRGVDLERENPGQFDLILVNSVVQYMTPDELRGWLRRWRTMLAPDGCVVLSDLIPPRHSTLADLRSLLFFSLRRGYLLEAVRNVLRERKRYGATAQAVPLLHVAQHELQRDAEAAGLTVQFLPENLTHFRGRITAVLKEKP